MVVSLLNLFFQLVFFFLSVVLLLFYLQVSKTEFFVRAIVVGCCDTKLGAPALGEQNKKRR